MHIFAVTVGSGVLPSAHQRRVGAVPIQDFGHKGLGVGAQGAEPAADAGAQTRQVVVQELDLRTRLRVGWSPTLAWLLPGDALQLLARKQIFIVALARDTRP